MSLPTNLGWWTGSFPYHRHANRTNSTLGKDTANPVANHHLRQFRYKLRSQISSSHFCYLTFSVFLPTPHFPCLLPPTQPHAPSLFVCNLRPQISLGLEAFSAFPRCPPWWEPLFGWALFLATRSRPGWVLVLDAAGQSGFCFIRFGVYFFVFVNDPFLRSWCCVHSFSLVVLNVFRLSSLFSCIWDVFGGSAPIVLHLFGHFHESIVKILWNALMPSSEKEIFVAI